MQISRTDPFKLQNKNVKMMLWLTLISIHSIYLFADDGSARRYATLHSDAITQKYFLISTKQVQHDLRLTQEQVRSIEGAISSPPTNIPAIATLRRSQEQLLDTAKSDEQRKEIHQNGVNMYWRLIHQNLEETLARVLSPIQTNRLKELYLQMEGPHLIIEDTNLIVQLQLADEQTNQMNDVSKEYDRLLSPLRHRLAGLQMKTVRRRDIADMKSEVECLARVIKETEKDQDFEILAVMSENQRNAWNRLCGTHLSIKWDIDYWLDIPFAKRVHY